MMASLIGAITIAGLSSLPAAATDAKPTVESLVKEGYEIVGVFPSSAGPGFVLQFEDEQGVRLMMCFASETPQSADVATQYCKPVH
jgi:predicted CoA-binding protein